jgi:hypothetical protein
MSMPVSANRYTLPISKKRPNLAKQCQLTYRASPASELRITFTLLPLASRITPLVKGILRQLKM